MKVLKPTTTQYNALNGYTNKSSELIFVKDGSGDFIVGLEVLTDLNFAAIRSDLNLLERVDYTPQEEIVE
tara:strand:- start:376 stop:585 length:210 start_codon:yes stop_codon:yes gene_type:complete